MAEGTGTWDPSDQMAELEYYGDGSVDLSQIPNWEYPFEQEVLDDAPLLKKFPEFDQKLLSLKSDLYLAAGAPWNKVEDVLPRLDWYEPTCTAENWTHQDVKLQLSVGIAYITLNRPAHNNTLNDTILHGLMDAVFAMHARKDIRIVVFNAEGKMFSAGEDPDAAKHKRDGTAPPGSDGSQGSNPVGMKEQSGQTWAVLWQLGQAALKAGAFPDGEVNYEQIREALLWQTLTRLPQVTIALVEGSCMGKGLIIPACVDTTIALSSVYFCMEDLKMGLVPALMLPHIVAKVGASKARFLMLSGSTLNGEDAKASSLVQILCETATQAHASIADICELVQKTGPVSVSRCKALVNGVAGNPITEKLMFFTAFYLQLVTGGEEASFSMKALLSKQPKPWEAEDKTIKPLYS